MLLWVHTWSADGASDTFSVPSPSNNDYHIALTWEDIPAGGAVPAAWTVPSASRTASDFLVETSGTVSEGTTVSVALFFDR